MSIYLPRKSGYYLNFLLGDVNISLLSINDKYAYKQHYEEFKYFVTMICILLLIISNFFVHHRLIDALIHFVLLWYYHTLTIRESILIANGSNIKGWWISTHFITELMAGILLIWPVGESYDSFRNQFMLYSLFVNFVQLLQYQYQSGQLYKMRVLGECHNLDITVDGFMTWMPNRLLMLMPFLFGVYVFQLYNCVSLLLLYFRYPFDWQILVVSVIFGLLASGNIMTTVKVIRQKFYSLPSASSSSASSSNSSSELSTKAAHATSPSHAATFTGAPSDLKQKLG